MAYQEETEEDRKSSRRILMVLLIGLSFGLIVLAGQALGWFSK